MLGGRRWKGTRNKNLSSKHGIFVNTAFLSFDHLDSVAHLWSRNREIDTQQRPQDAFPETVLTLWNVRMGRDID